MSNIPIPPQHPQRQDALNDQIDEVEGYFLSHTPTGEPVSNDPLLWVQVANRLGHYDAADHFRRVPVIKLAVVAAYLTKKRRLHDDVVERQARRELGEL